MNKPLRTALAAGIFIAGAVGGASAGATGTKVTTRVDNVAMKVYDLTPTDDQAAGYSISALTTKLTATKLYGDYESKTETLTGAGDVSVTRGGSSAYATWHGGVGQLDLVVTSNYDAPTTFRALAVQTFVVTVAPHSAFVLSGTSVLQGNAYGPNATNYSTNALVVSFDNGNPEYRNRDRFWKYGYYHNVNESADFALSFANTMDYAQDVTVTFDMSAEGLVSLVPEPSSYLMMGLGLFGLLGHARMRRKGVLKA
ncbi:PEP-CTERM sorting domain-containing protein [Massilia sp. YMA4]|uniref:PEP-CTERM sorting domain-containing protein n=1 Tax=Massilia sp. YMA4 TaxID=1593482 RepID=UPI001877F652|nr:PEP-CTERM sorting domain-containing protein [Massilia sp. YMA4]